jgi:hypothetical protein
MRATVLGLTPRYTYAAMAYVNPDAVTQIANGLSTSTFAYDNDGNLIQKTTDGTTTTYAYYANRLIALGVGGATTTYGYDAFGQRVLQTGTTTTYLYPFKWYSVPSSTGTGAKFATTTDYVFNGDSLVATVDQQTASGNATGTANSRSIPLSTVPLSVCPWHPWREDLPPLPRVAGYRRNMELVRWLGEVELTFNPYGIYLRL